MTRPSPGALPPHLDVAGWLLGALEPDEAATFEAHLASCSECQADVARLRPTLAVLTTAAEDVAVPAQLAERTVSAVRDAARQRQRRRWAIGGLVAAALVAVLTVGGLALFNRSDATTYSFAMSSPNGGPATGTATAHNTNRGWSIHLTARGLTSFNDKAFYECWYVDPTKDRPSRPFRVSAGTFDATPSGTVDVQMWSSADPLDFPVMQITVQPVNGNPTASQDVVLTGFARRRH